jgi:cell division protein FtsQ
MKLTHKAKRWIQTTNTTTNKRKHSMGARRKVIAQPVSPFMVRLARKRSWLLSLVLLGLVVAAGEGLLTTSAIPLLPIKSIELIGQLRNINSLEVQQAVAQQVRAGFFTVDVNAVKQAAEQLPWAQSVSVRRVWPDQLQIAVTEQQAIARWGDKAVLNAEGKLFYPTAQAMPANVVQLDGPPGTYAQLFTHYRELQGILTEQGLNIKRLWLTPRRAMQLELDNGIRLVLGKVRSTNESSALVARFAEAYGKALAKSTRKIRSVDLRYANGFSVKWAEKNKTTTSKKTPSYSLRKEESQLGRAHEDVFYG